MQHLAADIKPTRERPDMYIDYVTENDVCVIHSRMGDVKPAEINWHAKLRRIDGISRTLISDVSHKKSSGKGIAYLTKVWQESVCGLIAYNFFNFGLELMGRV